MLVGGVLASTGYALAPVSTADKTVYLPSVPASDDLTQRDASKFPYLIRTGWTSSQPHHPLGQWACDQGYKKIAAVAADYAFGYEVVGGFQKTFEDCGGKIVQKIWPPLGTKDFGPYIPTLKADADAVFSLMVGPMALQFPKQLRASGFKKPIVGGGTSYDEFALPFMDDGVIGDVSALQYSAALETPKNEAFVKAIYGELHNHHLLTVATIYTSKGYWSNHGGAPLTGDPSGLGPGHALDQRPLPDAAADEWVADIQRSSRAVLGRDLYFRRSGLDNNRKKNRDR
jgi:branched-chain amino acid transport system substrate-binding protein